MRRFLAILAALALLPTASLAWCDDPQADDNDLFISFLPGMDGAGVSTKRNFRRNEMRGAGSLYYNESKKRLLFCDGHNWYDVIEGGIDGTQTAGDGAPSKNKVHGPFSLPDDATRTISSVSNNKASYYEIDVWATGSTGATYFNRSATCKLDYKINNSWHRLVTGRVRKEGSLSSDDGPQSVRYEPGHATMRAYKQPNGQYKLVIEQNLVYAEDITSDTTHVGVREANTPTTALGRFNGTVRTDSSGSCAYKVMVIERNE